jgi:chromosome segregation ATPase
MPVEGVSFRGQGRGFPGGGGGGLKGSGMRQAVGAPRESFELADEKRFQTLRRRLTDEGYTHVLGFESAPLVHCLFDDLCALRETQTTMAHNLSEKTANEAKLLRQVHPIQKELSRMVRENNQLHLELIQRGEVLDTHQRKSALDTKKLQTKITDQAFIISQQAQHIRDLETQLDEHKERMQQLLDPNFTFTSSTPPSVSLPKGQEIMVSACPRPHETEDDEGPVVGQVVHDLESATAQQIAMLEEDLEDSKRTQETLELEVQSLQDAIRNRENEITRMGRLLVNNINSDKEDLERINSANEDTIQRLEKQLDFVSGQLADAERQKLQVQELAEEVENMRGGEAKLRSMLSSANAEVQELRALLQQPAGPARTGGGMPTPAKAGPGGEMHQTLGHSQHDAVGDGQHVACVAGRADVDAAHRQRLEMRVQELDVALKKRDAACKKLHEQFLLGQQSLSENEAKCAQVAMELTEMKRLRDNLYAVVWDFENQMAEVQVKIKELVSAREEKALQCSQAMDKVRRLQQQLSEATLGASSSDAHSQQVAQLLGELSEYRERVQELEAQVERADHELAAWAANDDSKGESSNSSANQNQMLSLKNEINELKTSLAASQREAQRVRAQLQQVESEKQEASSRMVPMEAKLAEKERAIELLQSLMSNMDETRGQVVSQLKVHMESSQASHRQTELLEAEVKRLLGELRRCQDELARSKAAIADIDGERDAMLNQLDEKTQTVRMLEGRLSEALKDQHTSLADVTSVQQQADMLRRALNERDAQYKALQMSLQNETQQRSGAEQLCNAKMEEARVLAAVSPSSARLLRIAASPSPLHLLARSTCCACLM